jgi:hypothetical protein
LLLIGFIIRFSLSDIAAEYLLELVHTLFPNATSVAKNLNSLYSDLNMQSKIQSKISYTANFCPVKNCQSKLDNRNCCVSRCCSNFKKVLRKYDSFSCIDIKEQVARILSTYYYDIIKHVSKKRCYIDLIDSPYYKNRAKPNCFNLILCTDGIQVTKNAASSVWPVVLTIAELPSIIRNSKSTKIIAGVWHGQNKPPNSSILFEHLFEELTHLNTNGFCLNINHDSIAVKLNLLGFVSDTPAKALCLNMINSNGYYGCPICVHPGMFFFHCNI